MTWLEGGGAGSEARRSSWVIGPDGREARAPGRVPPEGLEQGVQCSQPSVTHIKTRALGKVVGVALPSGNRSFLMTESALLPKGLLSAAQLFLDPWKGSQGKGDLGLGLARRRHPKSGCAGWGRVSARRQGGWGDGRSGQSKVEHHMCACPVVDTWEGH